MNPNSLPIVRENNHQGFHKNRNHPSLQMNNFSLSQAARLFPQRVTPPTTNNYNNSNNNNNNNYIHFQKRALDNTKQNTKDFLLEPRAIWEGQESKKLNHPANEARLAQDPSSFSFFANLKPEETLGYLMQRNRLLMRNAKTDDAAKTGIAKPNKDNDVCMDSDYFLDGRELERNVVVDYATDRSYVYTTDLGQKWQLPEFLFLDVPNSTYAARACGQFVTNKLILDLKQMIKPDSSHKMANMEFLVKNCNKSDYEVQNIYVPKEESHQKHHQAQQHSPSIETPVQAITARFRLRFARERTNIHKMLCHNFMNSQKCPKGILVFIPCMEKNSAAERFWGATTSVEPLPQVEEAVTNAKMDRYCFQVAKQHGTFQGKDPEQLGLVENKDSFGPFSNAASNWLPTNVARATTTTNNVSKKDQVVTKKVAPARKRTAKSLRNRSRIVRQKAVAVKTEQR